MSRESVRDGAGTWWNGNGLGWTLRDVPKGERALRKRIGQLLDIHASSDQAWLRNLVLTHADRCAVALLRKLGKDGL